jgi:hypothetical protein
LISFSNRPARNLTLSDSAEFLDPVFRRWTAVLATSERCAL